MLGVAVTACPPTVSGSRSSARTAGNGLGLLDRVLRLVAQVLEHDDELVAAETRDRVAFAHAVLEPLRDLGQHAVACFVPKGVVDVLAVIEVDEEQGAKEAGAVAVGERLTQAVEQEASVRQLRQRVDEGELADGGLGRPALGDVQHHAVHPARAAVAVEHALSTCADPMYPTKAAADAELGLVRRPPEDRGHHRLFEPRPVVRMDDFGKRVRLPHEVLRRFAGQVEDALVDVQDAPRRLGGTAEDHSGDVFDQRAKFVPAFGQAGRGTAHLATMADAAVDHREDEDVDDDAGQKYEVGFGVANVLFERALLPMRRTQTRPPNSTMRSVVKRGV